MATEMQVHVVSPSRPVAKVRAHSVNLPGTLGYMTILPGHAAMISELDVGRLMIDKVEHGEKLQYFIAGGYVTVENDQVTVLADVIESSKEIDKARATKSRERALDRLTGTQAGADMERARSALQRADARLNFLEGSK